MSERAAFISAILDNWADDTPRLVFADWLQENGEEARAEFIRAQINPVSLPESVRERSDPGARIAGKHGAALGGGWRRAIGVSETEGEYVRGFLTGVEVHSTDYIRLAGNALELEPVEFELELRALYPDGTPTALAEIEALSASRHLRAVRTITALRHFEEKRYFGPERFAELMESPHLINLRGATINEPGLGAVAVEALANAPAAFKLESLYLSGSLAGDRATRHTAVERIASAPRFASLNYLFLRFNQLDASDADVLLASKTLPRTLVLDVANNQLGRQRLAALAKRFPGGSDGDEDEDD